MLITKYKYFFQPKKKQKHLSARIKGQPTQNASGNAKIASTIASSTGIHCDTWGWVWN